VLRCADDRDPQRAERFPDDRDLRLERIRHLFDVGAARTTSTTRCAL
jgi:hypothetical protein